MSKNTVTIYANGGCAANIISKLPTESGDGIARMQSYYIDTSMSNLRKTNVPEEQIYIFEGVDGSGKVRAENHPLIAKNTLKILQDFKPATFSIVVHSASGGSGAVIGGSLVAELKKRGEQVVVVLIGSTSSHIEIENTLKTLKSYDAIANKCDKPIVVHYLENSATSSRAAIDAAATNAVLALLALFSGENDEMDTADLRNWMNHASLNPEMVSLHFCTSTEDYAAAGSVMTVATLAKHNADTSASPVPAYQTVGFVSGAAVNDFLGFDALHFAISSDLITSSAKSLTQKLKDSNAHLASNVRRTTLLERGDDQTDSGLIL